MLEISAACIVITALLAYVNQRFIGLPTAIGVMATALVLSLALTGLDAMGIAHALRATEESLLRSIDFSDVLMQGMLSLLLFAGALHVDLSELRAYRWQVAGLAVFGTALSTLVVGFAMWWVLPWLSLPLPLIHCLIFGALISPTDPIAVIGILKSAGAPRNLELVIAGESLFNDGVGVVLFALMVEMLASGEPPTAGHAAALLLQEAGGGVVFGLAVGYITFPPAAQHRPLPGRGAADAGCRDGRLCTGPAAACLRAVGHGGGRTRHWQPGPGAGDVGHHAPPRRPVLGVARRNPQRGAVRADRPWK